MSDLPELFSILVEKGTIRSKDGVDLSLSEKLLKLLADLEKDRKFQTFIDEFQTVPRLKIPKIPPKPIAAKSEGVTFQLNKK